jgi:hypothetical protein
VFAVTFFVSALVISGNDYLVCPTVIRKKLYALCQTMIVWQSSRLVKNRINKNRMMILMKEWSRLMLLGGLLIISTSVFAWGALGHQVACDLAWRDSSPEIKNLLSAAAKRMSYKTFAESCVWADHIKRQSTYDSIKPLHYINVPRSANTVATSPCLKQAAPQCVITAIDYYLARISDKTLKQKERDQALLLVGHFVADVHQPLHVAYADDKGGTQRRVVFSGKLLNLHSLWDSELLYCQLVSGKTPSWRRLGRHWYDAVSSLDDTMPSVITWADESLALTQQIYASVKQPSLPANYCSRYYPIVQQRLRLAGKRLSRLLAAALVP